MLRLNVVSGICLIDRVVIKVVKIMVEDVIIIVVVRVIIVIMINNFIIISDFLGVCL